MESQTPYASLAARLLSARFSANIEVAVGEVARATAIQALETAIRRRAAWLQLRPMVIAVVVSGVATVLAAIVWRQMER